MDILHLSWGQIRDAVARLDGALRREAPELEDRPRLVYGVPRGGCIVAALLTAHGWQPTQTPEEATVIVDDLVDSGRTLTPYPEQGFLCAVLFAKAPAPGRWWRDWPCRPCGSAEAGCISPGTTPERLRTRRCGCSSTRASHLPTALGESGLRPSWRWLG